MNNLEVKAAFITAALVLGTFVAGLAMYKIITNFTIVEVLTFLAIAGCSSLVYLVYKIVLSRLVYEQNHPKT